MSPHLPHTLHQTNKQQWEQAEQHSPALSWGPHISKPPPSTGRHPLPSGPERNEMKVKPSRLQSEPETFGDVAELQMGPREGRVCQTRAGGGPADRHCVITAASRRCNKSAEMKKREKKKKYHTCCTSQRCFNLVSSGLKNGDIYTS